MGFNIVITAITIWFYFPIKEHRDMKVVFSKAELADADDAEAGGGAEEEEALLDADGEPLKNSWQVLCDSWYPPLFLFRH